MTLILASQLMAIPTVGLTFAVMNTKGNLQKGLLGVQLTLLATQITMLVVAVVR